jgi:hypothetical protein
VVISRGIQPKPEAAALVVSARSLRVALQGVKHLVQRRSLDGGPGVPDFEAKVGLLAGHPHTHRGSQHRSLSIWSTTVELRYPKRHGRSSLDHFAEKLGG